MGLDAYINSFPAETKFDAEGRCLAGTEGEGYECGEVGYFCKVNWLHNWMQVLYAKRTGNTNPSDFNCVHLVLSKKDLLDLQQDIKDDNISPVTGFFFGANVIYPKDKEKVMKVITESLFEIFEGKVITYSSWW